MAPQLSILHSARLLLFPTPLKSVDTQKADDIQRQMRLLRDDMNDIHGKLRVEQDRFDIAADEKTKAEELAVCFHWFASLRTECCPTEKEAVQ